MEWSQWKDLISGYYEHDRYQVEKLSKVVLLFESRPGWNQFGGPELLTFDNHGGRGCNILFSDGKIRFIKPEDAVNLRWKLDEAQQK